MKMLNGIPVKKCTGSRTSEFKRVIFIVKDEPLSLTEDVIFRIVLVQNG